MKLSVKKLSQNDPVCKAEKLGTSALTIGDAGCVLACVAMIENYYGFETDLLQLNQLFKDNGVYVNRNLVDFTKIEKVNEFVKFKEKIDCETTPAPLKKVDLEIAEGRPVIVKVDLNPNQPGSDHYVVIFGKTDDGHYFAYDPWFVEDAIYFDARYGDPVKGIFGLRLISGPVPKADEPKPSVGGLTKQVETLKQQVDDIRTVLKLPVDSDVSDFTKKIVELQGVEEDWKEHLSKEKDKLEAPEENAEYMGQFKFLGLTIRLYVDKKGGDENE